MIKKYKRKMSPIQAIQFLGNANNINEISNFLEDSKITEIRVDYSIKEPILKFETPKGNIKARKGDWIIKGIKGEIFSCNSKLFENVYEEVK